MATAAVGSGSHGADACTIVNVVRCLSPCVLPCPLGGILLSIVDAAWVDSVNLLEGWEHPRWERVVCR